MEINPHLKAGGVERTTPSQSAAQGTKVERDQVAFENAAALEKSLRSTPDTRDDVIEMAKKLVNNVEYPPPETIRKISNLLALNLIVGKS